MDDSTAVFRAKLYKLSPTALWDDAGTGNVEVLYDHQDRKRLLIRDEEDGESLLDSPVWESDKYELQGDGSRQTIIVWEDPPIEKVPDSEQNYALSFQDPDGALLVYEMLTKDDTIANRILPLPKLGNLNELSALLQCVPPSQREQFATECASSPFLSGLREAFEAAESLANKDALVQLWHIAKGMFLLSSQKLTTRLLRADLYEVIMGMLENDDGISARNRMPHRQILSDRVSFKQVVSIGDAVTLEKIHLNFRLAYLKDLVLPRLLDDGGFALIAQMLNTNSMQILAYVQKSPKLLEQLFGQIRNNDRLSLSFLQEMCRLAKVIPLAERQGLYDTLVEAGFLQALKPFLQNQGQSASPGVPCPVALAVEILLMSAMHNATHLRQLMISEAAAAARGKRPTTLFISVLIQAMVVEKDQGTQVQIAETLKAIMDPSTLEQNERDGFLDVFYDHGGLDELAAPLRPDYPQKAEDQSDFFGRQLICDLLAYAMQHHGYKARVFVMRNNLAQHALRLMYAPYRFVQLAPLRLLRAMVGTKDDGIARYIAKNALFTPVMRVFQQCLELDASLQLGGNLLVSAMLELLEFIRVTNIKPLVNYIAVKHVSLIEEFRSRYKTLDGLGQKYKMNLEYEQYPPEHNACGGPMLGATALLKAPRRQGPGGEDCQDDDDGEAYFESLDEDEAETGDNAAGTIAETLVPGRGVEQQQTSPKSGQQKPQQQPQTSDAEGGTEAKQEAAATKTLSGLLGSYDEEEDDDENGTTSPPLVNEGGAISPDRLDGQALKAKSSCGNEGGATNVSRVSKRLRTSLAS